MNRCIWPRRDSRRHGCENLNSVRVSFVIYDYLCACRRECHVGPRYYSHSQLSLAFFKLDWHSVTWTDSTGSRASSKTAIVRRQWYGSSAFVSVDPSRGCMSWVWWVSSNVHALTSYFDKQPCSNRSAFERATSHNRTHQHWDSEIPRKFTCTKD